MLPLLVEKITLLKHSQDLTKEQIRFLCAWFKANGIDFFGFRGVTFLDEQLKEAVVFLKKTERVWQDRVRANQTSLEFPQFFTYSALTEGIQLASDFESYLTEELKGVDDES